MLLALEVEVDRALRDAGGVRDLLHRRVVEALGAEELEGGGEDLRPALLGRLDDPALEDR